LAPSETSDAVSVPITREEEKIIHRNSIAPCRKIQALFPDKQDRQELELSPALCLEISLYHCLAVLFFFELLNIKTHRDFESFISNFSFH
jgi:hypothetical protein